MFYTIPIIIGAVVFNIPTFFMIELDDQGFIQTNEIATTEEMINYATYARPLIIFVLPVLFLLTFNYLTYRKINSLSSTISNSQR